MKGIDNKLKNGHNYILVKLQGELWRELEERTRVRDWSCTVAIEAEDRSSKGRRRIEESCVLYNSKIKSACYNVFWVIPESGGKDPNGLFEV